MIGGGRLACGIWRSSLAYACETDGQSQRGGRRCDDAGSPAWEGGHGETVWHNPSESVSNQPPTMLEARHLVKRYFGVTVVDDVSFVVGRGEVVGYLGPNGSGKTTTGRMLTGLVEPSGGMVLFEGRPVSDDPLEFRRRMGYVPEEPMLYPFLSAREQLRLLGRLRELPASSMERKMDSLIELFGLGEAAEQPISAYSKGMKQKVLIIAALLHDPDLLIFDEPDSGLDVTTLLVLRHLVHTLAARGKAILYSSHVLEVVEKLCTRVIVLHHGRIVAQDTIQQLRTLMAHESLEEVFAELVLEVNPQQTARDIADVVTGA
jgi:ABC-2 type transport system ATP-binding protein